MIEVTCPKCKRNFQCDAPTAETNHIVFCPYCGTNCRVASKDESARSANGSTCQYCGKPLELYSDKRSVFRCSYCDAEYKRKSVPHNSDPSRTHPVVKKTYELEFIANVCWLIVGAYQLFLWLYWGTWSLFALGIYNAVVAIISFRSLKNIYAGNKELVEWYDKRFTAIVVVGIINLVIGAVIGAAVSALNLYTRNYVLKNREVFENETQNLR